jgi:alcohol dehydrogenase class IV
MSTILYLTSIIIESGAIKQLNTECLKLGIKKPLLVTDAGIKAAGILETALKQIKDLEVHIFDQTPSNPTEAAVRAACHVYKTQNCDGIIALGGGSSIDCAKGVAIAVSHPGALKTYATIEGGSGLITNSIPPIIAIPTTAGTGSEVARGAILILDDGRKVGFHSWNILPKVAISDPNLTVGLPPLLTAATGMDAIAHCMETFMAAPFNPPADGIALDGLGRAWENIEKATRNGNDIDARLQMMSASMQGALAFQKGLGCVHSLSHSLGGVNPRLHHGTLNAMFLPAVIEFNADCESVIKEKRLSKMAHAMGLSSAAEVANAVTEMNARLGLPKGLKEMGVNRTDFADIIKGALADHCHKTNPRLASSQDYEAMLEQASFNRI